MMMFSTGQGSCSGRSKKTDLTSRFFYAHVVLANGVLQLRGQRQCCWHNTASMRRCGRRTAGKYSLIRNPRVSLGVQVILPSIIFAILFHSSRAFCNA